MFSNEPHTDETNTIKEFKNGEQKLRVEIRIILELNF